MSTNEDDEIEDRSHLVTMRRIKSGVNRQALSMHEREELEIDYGLELRGGYALVILSKEEWDIVKSMRAGTTKPI